jgi:predicted esterase
MRFLSPLFPPIFFVTRCIRWAITSLLILHPLASFAEAPAPPQSPAGMVWEYLLTNDAGQADRLLPQILNRYDGNPDALKQAIRSGPPYTTQPVGVLPDERIVLRDRAYRYSLYVPPSYFPTESYALIVCLHGAGFSGDAYLERWQPRLGERYILVCPSYPAGSWFTRRAEDLVLAVIRSVQRRYHIDPDRIFLTGMSNGGIGAWLIGMHHAPLFAGIAPMASGIDDVLFPFLENLRNTPVYIIHGSQDQVMPVELSRKLVKELDHLGYSHVYHEHERTHPLAGGHYFPREELPELVQWFDTQHRITAPKNLTVVREASHLLPFGWIRIDATDRIASFSEDLVDKRDDDIRRRSYARVMATVGGSNRIDVRTDHVRQYTLFLNEDLVDVSLPITVVTDGAVSYEGPVTSSIETLLRQMRLRQDSRQLFPISLTIPVRKQPS